MLAYLVILQEQVQSPLEVGLVITAIAGLIGAITWLIRTLGIRYGETRLRLWTEEKEAAIKADQYHRDRASWREDKYFDILTTHMESLEKFLTSQQVELKQTSLSFQHLAEATRSQNEILSDLYESLHTYVEHKPKAS